MDVSSKEMAFAQILASLRRGEYGLCADTRQLAKGNVFVAIPGANDNGAKYIQDAAKAGASAIVCQNDADSALGGLGNTPVIAHPDPHEALWRMAQAYYHTDQSPLSIFAITGTNGKTTCAYLLEHLFKSAGHKVGVLGTISYRWPGHCETASLTTPDPIRLHAMLAKMAASGVDTVIMEASSHAIEQQRVSGISFAGAAFTNLTQDHLDYHKDMSSYFAAKARLFLDLPKKDKALAINADDPWGRKLLELCPQVCAYSLADTAKEGRSEIQSKGPHLRARLLSSGPGGLSLHMEYEGAQWQINSPLVGRFNAYNLLTVQALALKAGMEMQTLSALADFHGVPGRLERIKNPQGMNVFVDYAHTPDALVNALEALRGAGFKRVIAVFGCGGNRDRTKRPLMGEAVSRLADLAVLTSDNPRYERPMDIIEDVLPGLVKAKAIIVEPDRRKATARALEALGKDDALLIAGKGHEDYQIIQGEHTHYSDQEVVREFLGCA